MLGDIVSDLQSESIKELSNVAHIRFEGDNDAYDSSRVMLHDVIYRFKVSADLIVIIPSLGRILATAAIG